MIIPKITEKIEAAYYNNDGDVYVSCSTDNIISIHDVCNSFECKFDISQLEKIMNVLDMMDRDWEENADDYDGYDDFDFSPRNIWDEFDEDVKLINWNYILRSRAYLSYGALEKLKDKLDEVEEDIDIKSIDKKELLTFSIIRLNCILDRINAETNHSDSSSKDRKENVV